MITTTINANDQYQDLLALIQGGFTKVDGTTPLFTTDADGLFGAYLLALPAEARQHHTCTACRRFMETFGGLVTIRPDGSTMPAIWDAASAPAYYRDAIAAVEALIRRAKVTGVFLSTEKVWGKPVTGPWTHFAVTPPPGHVFRPTTRTAF
jgi:hypothetical protein